MWVGGSRVGGEGSWLQSRMPDAIPLSLQGPTPFLFSDVGQQNSICLSRSTGDDEAYQDQVFFNFTLIGYGVVGDRTGLCVMSSEKGLAGTRCYTGLSANSA